MTDDRPYLSLWFGNFFEPFLSDRDALRSGVADVADMGFTVLNLDSKPWEDFFARYRGEPASTYVGGQELMIAEAHRHGLEHTCLALYLCGDNLYPAIRDTPPVRGEEAVRPDGGPMGSYVYFSELAQDSMVEHVQGLLRLYGEGMRRRPDGRTVVQTMFDPVARPSFDDAGRAHYLAHLRRRHGDIAAVNARYGTDAASFTDLAPHEYWLRPEELTWIGCARPTATDLAERTPDFHRWIDNQTYLADTLVEYFAAMHARWDKIGGISAEPVLQQWGFFFDPPGADDWTTGTRALDVFRIAPHVDEVMWMASPINAENRPDATALSLESAIMRSANGHRAFTGGLFLGRHVNGDLLHVVSPAEAMATHVVNGATGLHSYGYSGLDDGGVLYRAEPATKASIRAGNEWVARVAPQLTAPRERDVALLLPAATVLYQPFELDPDGRTRTDTLGWYRQLTDLGHHVDVLHPDQVAAGGLAPYRVLVVPDDPLYDLGARGGLADAVRTWTAAGGTVLHGPRCGLAAEAFGITDEPVEFDGIGWEEEVVPHGWSTVAFDDGEAVGHWLRSGRTALARHAVGEGRVLSFGFEYGYSYARASMPIVPPEYGRREMHPLPLLRRTPVEALIGAAPDPVVPPTRGVEVGRFGDRVVVVNHRSEPVDLSAVAHRGADHLVPSAPGLLAAHSAVLLDLGPA